MFVPPAEGTIFLIEGLFDCRLGIIPEAVRPF
jgi:hypothetical protein